MLKLRVILHFLVTSQSSFDENTDNFLRALLEEEAGNGSLSDADVTAIIGKSVLTASIAVKAPSWEEAERVGVEAILSAIYAIGGVVQGEVSPESAIEAMGARLQSTELVPA